MSDGSQPLSPRGNALGSPLPLSLGACSALAVRNERASRECFRSPPHRFCQVSRFGLAAISGAARLNPARTVPAMAPRWS
jgi:hypothetical protein